MRSHPRLWMWTVAVLAPVLVAGLALAAADLDAWWAGEEDLYGHRRFDPPPTDRTAITQIDFGLVHGELWPAWVTADENHEPAAYQRLLDEVSPDAYLAARVRRTRKLALEDPVGNVRHLMYQVWAWNRYCDLIGAPWHLTAGVNVNGPDDATFYVKSYQVISDTPTRVGRDHWRTRVVQRVDDLSAVEGYLGLTSDHEQGAVVVTERIAAFALERIWPLLDPELDPERLAIDARFAPGIRDAARAALHPTDLTVLALTAADRFWLERAIAEVHGRARCGSRFQIAHLPFDGLHHRDLREVRRYAAATAADPCPEVTHLEAAALTLRSQSLQATAGLQQALEALNAWVGRSIAIHEARHAADDALPGELPCPTCPEAIRGVPRLEASAYLASFADPGTAPVALLQACAVRQVDAAGRAEAIGFVVDQLGDPCATGPTPELPAKARELERTLFGRDEEIVLHPDFPALLPLERAVRSGLPPVDVGGARQGDIEPE